MKIKEILPVRYYKLQKSYLSAETSNRLPSHSGVPQGRILGQLLYVPYTYDLPITSDTMILLSLHLNAIVGLLNL